MGVPTRIVLYAQDFPTARDAAAAAFSHISEIESVLSDYRPDSEANRLCDSPISAPVRISQTLFTAIDHARAIAELSDGALDITVGPATLLWREARRSGRPPTAQQVETARQLIDYRSIILDNVAHTARLTRPGTRLDFGGIGKGLAAQSALDFLCARGHRRALVGLAGDITVGDPPPNASGWQIEVAGTASPTIFSLANRAISTSGDAEQFVVIDGRRYSHIIDPRTGLGTADHRSVTIVAPTGDLADGLATAACIVGPEATRLMMARLTSSSITAVFTERNASCAQTTIIGKRPS